MGVYEQWKKQVEENISKFRNEDLKEKIPSLVRRCPKCLEFSLEFDIKRGIIYCSKCGFKEDLPMIKKQQDIYRIQKKGE